MLARTLFVRAAQTFVYQTQIKTRFLCFLDGSHGQHFNAEMNEA